MAAPKKSVAKESGQDKAGSPPEFSREQELKALRDMLLIRRFEEKAGQLYGMGAIGGFCHLYIGQEAVVVGMQMALKPGDQVITGYRDHGHMLACGMSANGVMAELTGRRTGYSRGKGGSMHMFDRANKGAKSSILRRLGGDEEHPARDGILKRYGMNVIGKFEDDLQKAIVTRKPMIEVRNDLIASSPFLQQAPAHWAQRIVRT